MKISEKKKISMAESTLDKIENTNTALLWHNFSFKYLPSCQLNWNDKSILIGSFTDFSNKSNT